MLHISSQSCCYCCFRGSCFLYPRFIARTFGWRTSARQRRRGAALFPIPELSDPLIRVNCSLGNEFVEACKARLPDDILVPTGRRDTVVPQTSKQPSPDLMCKSVHRPRVSKTRATPQPYHTCWPRQYPLRFGMRIVTLKHNLKAQATGKPKPQTMPDLREQLIDMNCQQGLGDIWEEASMDEVLVYLRGNRNLMLPDWARPLLPSTV